LKNDIIDRFVLSKMSNDQKYLDLYSKIRFIVEVVFGYVLKIILTYEGIIYLFSYEKVTLDRHYRNIALIMVTAVYFIYFFKKNTAKIIEFLKFCWKHFIRFLKLFLIEFD
jgi:hypothetical protein